MQARFNEGAIRIRELGAGPTIDGPRARPINEKTGRVGQGIIDGERPHGACLPGPRRWNNWAPRDFTPA